MFSALLHSILAVCPTKLCSEIRRVAEAYPRFEARLSELRVRAGRLASLTLDGRNVPLQVCLSAEELAGMVRTFCQGSVYAYSESLREGYISFGGGCRVGVAGRAITEDGVPVGVGEVTSLSIRIPHHVPGAGNTAVSVFRAMGCRHGLLVYSAPGVGKTTVLRDMAVQLSSGASARRVAVIDSRGELDGDCIGRGCLADVLLGYPKAEGIEIATRTLSPEVVVCDEIGGYEDAESVLALQHCGVPLIASAHADTTAGLLARSPIRLLVDSGVFGAFVGIFRGAGNRYTYRVDYHESIIAAADQPRLSAGG
ncbi:MAG: hypothetical protein WDA00_03745 [Eubacteriales bacterium]